MQIKVAKRDLVAALKTVTPCVAGTGEDISTHVVFRYQNGGLEVLASASRLNAKSRVIAQTEADEGSAFSVCGKAIEKWLRAVADAALELDYEEGVVRASSPRGSVKFQSLDPKSMPDWDSQLESSKPIFEIDGDRLSTILSFAKDFASQDEADSKLRVLEIKEGHLWSCTGSVICRAQAKEFSDSNLRLHKQDIPSVTKFLANAGTIKVLENDRVAFFERADGSVFGVQRFNAEFPAINVPDGTYEDPYIWELSKKDLTSAVKILRAACEDPNIRLCRKGDKIEISMTSFSGFDTIEIPVSSYTEAEDPLPKRGFQIAHQPLMKIVSAMEEDTVSMGITMKSKRQGLVRITDERDEVSYYNLISWV